MELTQLTPAALSELIKLVEEKQTIVDQIAKLDAAIEAVAAGRAPVKSAAPKAPRTAAAPAVKADAGAPASPKAPAVRAKRGALKEGILAALEAAGPQGLPVTEIAAKLGVESANVHVWFSTTGKKLPGITKISAGRYALAGGAAAAVAPAVANPEEIAAPAPEISPVVTEVTSEPAPELGAEPVAAEAVTEETPTAVEDLTETGPASEIAAEEPAAEETFEQTTVEPVAEDTPVPTDDDFQLTSPPSSH